MKIVLMVPKGVYILEGCPKIDLFFIHNEKYLHLLLVVFSLLMFSRKFCALVLKYLCILLFFFEFLNNVVHKNSYLPITTINKESLDKFWQAICFWLNSERREKEKRIQSLTYAHRQTLCNCMLFFWNGQIYGKVIWSHLFHLFVYH